MPSADLYPFMFKRKSVRKYKPDRLSEQQLADLRAFIADAKPLVPGIRTEMRIIDSSSTKGMARTDAPHYLAFFSEDKENCYPNAGFMLQQVDLYLSSKGLGNCYQGMAKITREVEAPSGLDFIYLMSFGSPLEEAHRKDTSEFKREPLDKISAVKGNAKIMEAARLAPSGVNNQSWFFTGNGAGINVYYAKSLITDKMNQINAGIALCHLWLAAEHEGKKVSFVSNDAAKAATVKGFVYVVSMKME